MDRVYPVYVLFGPHNSWDVSKKGVVMQQSECLIAVAIKYTFVGFAFCVILLVTCVLPGFGA